MRNGDIIMKKSSRDFKNIILIGTILSLSNVSYATISVGLSGSGSQNNAGLEKHKSSSGSVSLSVSLGAHVRAGVNYRVSKEKRNGLKTTTSNNQVVYYNFNNDLDSVTYSTSLTLILYNGKVSPYIFGGIANKYYTSEFVYETAVPVVHTTKYSLEKVPTYGLGAAIMINRQFSLKVSQTYSPGKFITIDPDGNEVKSQPLDSYTQIGISYNFS